MSSTSQRAFGPAANPYINYFALWLDLYKARLRTGEYSRKASAEARGLSRVEVQANKEAVFWGCLEHMDKRLGWLRHKKVEDRDAVRRKLESPDTHLYLFFDRHGQKPGPIGFGVVKVPDPDMIGLIHRRLGRRFDKPASQTSCVEIDYLGLFEGRAGKGRGKAFFEMFFEDLLLGQGYDVVCWTQNSSNAETLEDYYLISLGMYLFGRKHDAEIFFKGPDEDVNAPHPANSP